MDDTGYFKMVKGMGALNMYILGLGGSNHDYSACLVKDGEVICMIDDERITRKKYGMGLGMELAKGFSRKYCLDEAGISLDDVDVIVANDIVNPVIYHHLNDKVHLINHHLSHAAAAFYPSEWGEAAILVVDGVGSQAEADGKPLYETVTFAHGKGTDITVLKKQYGENLPGTEYIENSLGIFYALITEVIGFGEHEEGKTMGLAPYGTDRLYDEIQKYFRYLGEGRIEMTRKDIEAIKGLKVMVDKEAKPGAQLALKADIAWAGQKILENTMIELSNHIYSLTGCQNLCIGGGTGLNSVANYKIYKKSKFKNLYIMPATADNGTAIGAALYGYHVLKGRPRLLK